MNNANIIITNFGNKKEKNPMINISSKNNIIKTSNKEKQECDWKKVIIVSTKNEQKTTV